MAVIVTEISRTEASESGSEDSWAIGAWRVWSRERKV
jgi:hypothetical protein